MVDWSSSKLGPLCFGFWLMLKSVIWEFNLLPFKFEASGSFLINVSREGCMSSVLLLTEGHLRVSFKTEENQEFLC